MEDDLVDWEVLNGSDSESITSDEKSRSSSVIDDGMILSDHFSATDLSQSGLIEPGDSSRVDYGLEPPVVVDQSGDACVRNELGIYDSKIGVSSDVSEVRLSEFESKCLSESDDLEVSDGRHVENQSGVEERAEDISKSWSDSGGNEMVSGDSEIVNGQEEIVSSEEVGAVRCGDESESKSREIVWWKMPFVLLKYSVFKIGPVWSVSMAAAVMGLVLLGRRLYNMKKKAQRFHLKVTIDDKKVSRVMSQAARLNEVFTEVRRVPVIRSALPSPVAWPVLSLR
ncbi:ATG8-interacting protein 2 [Cardamine amara subsp. amara]|uniref:ATG8-interacting protein 2 n=1 Tax=Cardamine amara subsp. amara TaxID=228776 RepID=A0ABD1A624_CARAN